MANPRLRGHLARNIQHHLGRRHWSVTELADEADVSRSMLYHVIKKECGASIDVVEKLGNALDIDPWLLLRPPC